MDLDSIFNDFLPQGERVEGEKSALFGKQPHTESDSTDSRGSSVDSAECLTSWMLRTRVFKHFAIVPDVTLNFAQLENAMTPFGSDSSLSPLLSDIPSPTCTDTTFSTPSLSLSTTPASLGSELSPYKPSDQIWDPSPTIPFDALSPLPSDSLSLLDNTWDASLPLLDNSWDVSPISATVDLPSLRLFSSQSLKATTRSETSAAVHVKCLTTLAQGDSQKDEERDASPKRRRLVSPGLEIELAPASPVKRGTSASRKARRKSSAVKGTHRKPVSPTAATDSTNFVLDISGSWLKLSPLSNAEVTSPSSSYPSLPVLPSLSPSTPAASSPLKRKRELVSPSPLLAAPFQLPEDEPIVSDNDAHVPPLDIQGSCKEEESQEPAVCASDAYIYRDFMTAKSLVQRKSDRSRAPISYVGLDEDVYDDTGSGKAKSKSTRGTAAKGKHSASSARVKSSRKSSVRPAKKGDPTDKFPCPFSVVCSSVFSRVSDITRHLECNALHTYTGKSWHCPNCGAILARNDSYVRHYASNACGKRSSTGKAIPVYTPEVEEELERIRNSSHPAISCAKRKLAAAEDKEADGDKE